MVVFNTLIIIVVALYVKGEGKRQTHVATGVGGCSVLQIWGVDCMSEYS